jgi:dimethylhistidine N-methyltransferase
MTVEPAKLVLDQPPSDRSSAEQSRDEFARDVRTGLTSSPKQLLPKYFYDELGSFLFEAICRVPEYCVTRDEDEILSANAAAIINECKIAPGERVNLIELGSGTSSKTRHLIEALFDLDISVCYRAIDVSAESLGRSENALLTKYPTLGFVPYPYDYFVALPKVAADISSDESAPHRNIGLFLGSSIGNLDFPEAARLLLAMRDVLGLQDSFLIGADLTKAPEILLPAYNDVLGVTAAFNLNLLVRINRELGGKFDLRKFEHRAIFNEDLSRVEMHLFSRERQDVEIRSLALNLHFEAGESIHTENSYKFDLNTLSRLATETGFRLTKTWFDTNQRFGLNLLTPADAG